MVLFNYSTKELTAKVVYYGPGLCGKTTNLQWVHDKLPIKNKGKMLSLATETDRTLFFDFLPIELGAIRGMKTRIQLYTVPGQVFYNATRRMVLKGADGVVFVADSQEAMLDANAESLENLRENLEVNEISLDSVPLVLQYNKRDLPNAASIEAMNARLNPRGVPYFEAVAVQGVGVEETLKGITGLVFKSLARRYGGPEGAAAAAEPGSPNPRRKSVTGSIPIVPTPLPTPTAPAAPPVPAAPAADAFSPEDLLEIDEPPPASSEEPLEEFSLDELGPEPGAPAATTTAPPLDLDSLQGPPTAEPVETLETVEEFSPLAELEGFLEEAPPEGPTSSFGGATQPPEPDPLAELELEPDSPAQAPAVAGGFDPGELSLGDEPAAPEPPMRLDESAEISLDASELLEPPPPEPEPALELDADPGAMEPQIDFGAPEPGDAFDPMALVGSDTEPARAEPEPPDTSGVGAATPPGAAAAFDADPLAGLAGAAESPPVPPETPPVEAPPFDPSSWASDTGPAEEPAVEIGPDTGFPEAIEMPSFDETPASPPGASAGPASLESLGDPDPHSGFEPPVPEPAPPPPAPEPQPPAPERQPMETGFDLASLDSLGDPEPTPPEPPQARTPTSELFSLDSLGEPVPDAVSPASVRTGPRPESTTAPISPVPPEPEPEPEPEPAAEPEPVAEPAPVPASVGVGVAATASSVPAAALATAVPTADVRTASLAVTGQGENEITIPVEIALGPGGTTQLNLNIRLTLNFKMK